MNYKIRHAGASDATGIVALLPRLADFDVPENRKPSELWSGDAAMFQAWLSGDRPDIEVLVATDAVSGSVLGVSMVSFRKEMLSGKPSSHLEVLALDKSAEGQGIASELMERTQSLAIEKGATSMSLHVFANNRKARALYERKGFKGELLRYSKPLI